MKCCILFSSPRKQGNTAALLSPFTEEMRSLGWQTETFDLYSMDIRPCLACRGCQADHSKVGCVQKDDMQKVFDSVTASDLIVFASPIYSWYCTPPMKAALDRLVYGMNKYYGEIKGPSLWAGKTAALITTCGYRPEKGADLFAEGLRRYCKHSQLKYYGMLAERHMGYDIPFMDESKEKNARRFAQLITESMSNPL